MAPEIPLENQRPAEYVFDKIVREVADTTPKKSARKEQPNHAA
jgi:hypothetical protein